MPQRASAASSKASRTFRSRRGALLEQLLEKQWSGEEATPLSSDALISQTQAINSSYFIGLLGGGYTAGA